MICDDVRAALSSFDLCVETDEGARVSTHCLYPSFSTVHVYVAKLGDGYHIHDGGGAYRSAWNHACDDAVIGRAMLRHSLKFRVAVRNSTLVVDVPSADWLKSAVLAVANASSAVAYAAVEHVVATTENRLKDRIFNTLRTVVGEKAIGRSFDVIGRSGKIHEFDFGVKYDGSLLLIDAVSPHHVSVSAKYVAFADAGANDNDGSLSKFAVFDRELDRSDVSLLQQVADLVPIRSLDLGVKRLVNYASL
tara:strand:+ start:618 stop:1364 length:747 start_codon:yes stop_codon:yes gene_type:complete